MSLWTELNHTPHELRFVDAGGTKTRALVGGEGEPVVFLHGISGHLEAYIPTFAAHAEHFEVHAIDMLGHGYSGKPSGLYTIDVLADHVVAYLDANGIERAHISGLSLGGWVTGHIAATRPERVLSATMTCSAGGPLPGSGESREKVAEMIRRMTRDAVLSDDPEMTRERLGILFDDKSHVTEELVEVRHGIYQLPETREAIDGILALTDPDLYEESMLTPEQLGGVEAEVMLVWSEEDPVAKLESARHFVEQIPKNRLVRVPNCGHWPPFERPDIFSRVSVAFLGGGLDAIPDEDKATLEPAT